ncbi:uncharacterized protein C8Q71DRAFT_805910 [Rhodofomes roseus]|uniref:HIT-type domain-containing protein n=1 Tax=Rhodofomes roseus TaxID=34475 RepID=A0ABQ8KRE8_9APHY|nr:uncharacterized protein C8Q71DRAFT_805910 [Rhodofomes roseus]KAH9840290.1 hypothetical protein C8Q71DRAFT_805910 [Rhodofomes roseus]
MDTTPAPTDIQTQPATETTSSLPCAICRRQFSRYTCPKCNIPYCSLTCFRSETHAGCSESFYRKEIESDVRGNASKTAEQRMKTLELLKHFEEDSMNDDVLGLDADDSDDEGGNLESRLRDLDIDAASYDDLWAALTPAEREMFTKALRDPNSELAQQLLSSEELEKVRIEPWWEAPDDPSTDDPSTSWRAQKRYGKKPAMMPIPENMVGTSHTPGKYPLLLYNICAVMVAYAYVTRHFATSPLTSLDPSERDEARRIIAQLVPFLSDRLSKTVHSSLSAAVTDILSRFQTDAMPLAFFSLLLRDAAGFLQPSTVVELPVPATPDITSPAHPAPTSTAEPASHPSARALLALSDLSALFTADKKQNHVTHKLTFYAAYMMGVPPVLLRTLAGEVAERAEGIAREGIDLGGIGPVPAVGRDGGPDSRSRDKQTTKIVELS